MSEVIKKWHEIVASKDMNGLKEILHKDAVFYSPVLFAPQKGRALTSFYLTAAGMVLLNDTFTYINEVASEKMAVLEFTTVIDGITINGVDMIQWNNEGLITEFKVMARPLNGLLKIKDKMMEMMQHLEQG